MIVISLIGTNTEDVYIQNHNLRNGLATGKFISLFHMPTIDGLIFNSIR